MDIANLLLHVAEHASSAAQAATADPGAAEAAEETTGFIGTLGLNWKLFIAQLINFSVVLFVLWRWVFKPVGGALESRRQKIAESVKQAEEMQRKMIAFEKEREQKMAEARKEAEEITKQAVGAANEARADIVAGAKKESEKMVANAKAMIENEKKEMLREVKTEITDLVTAATEKLIGVRLDEKKDKDLINKVIESVK